MQYIVIAFLSFLVIILALVDFYSINIDIVISDEDIVCLLHYTKNPRDIDSYIRVTKKLFTIKIS